MDISSILNPLQSLAKGATSEQTDKDALDLAHSIMMAEGGGTPKYKSGFPGGTPSGKDGERGAGQWMPGRYEKDVSKYKQYLKSPDIWSPENQDIVLYHSVLDDKNSGLQPHEIAAKWNSGNPNNWQNHKGVNVAGHAYDTPAYVQRVKTYYQQLKQSGQTGQPDTGYITEAQLPPKPKPEQKPQAQTQSPLDYAGNVAGQTLGAIGGGITGGLKSIGSSVLGLAYLPQAAGKAIAETVTGKPAPKEFKTIGEMAKESGLSKSLEAKNAAEAGGGTAMELAQLVGPGKLVKGLLNDIPRFALKAIARDVAPELTKKTAIVGATKQGLTKTGILGKISPVTDKKTQEMAKTVYDNVSNFNNMGTYTEKLNATKNANYKMADELKNKLVNSGENGIYSYKELASKLNAIEEPISLKGTAFEKQVGPLKKAVLQMAKKNGGKISGLFDTRKEFDQLVDKTWPNIWDKEHAPMLNVVRAVRNEMNDFIEKRVPSLGYKDSLKAQSQLFDAIDNLAPKAVREIGTTSYSRSSVPGLIGIAKKIAGGGSAAGLGLGGAAAYEYLKGQNR